MSELASCLRTCSREHGHAAGCPVLAEQRAQATQAVVGQQNQQPLRGMGTVPNEGYIEQRESAYEIHQQRAAQMTPAALAWGRAAAELISAKHEMRRAEVALDKAKARLATAYSRAHAERAALEKEASALLNEDAADPVDDRENDDPEDK